MPLIKNDKDLPELLNTPAKQTKWAKQLVTKHLKCAPKRRTTSPPFQGMYSRTLFLSLTDGREVVIQFRTEPLDVSSFTVAKKVLGSYVPDVQYLEDDELESNGVWAYCSNRMPGLPWIRAISGKGITGRIAVAKSLGCVLSKGFMADNSHEAIESTVRPHLDAILSSSLEEILPYRARLEAFSKRLDEFGQLPLWIAHYDLNEVNVLLDENCEVTALVDWELSTPLPFGIGFGRIHTYAGEFYFPDEYEAAERGFWQGLFDDMPGKVRQTLHDRIHFVQDAILLGTLLDCFYLDNGKVGCSRVSLKALPKFLSYQVPHIRGEGKPYRD